MRRSLVRWGIGVAVFAVLLFLLVARPGVEVVEVGGVAPDTAREPFRVQIGDSISFVVSHQDQGVADEVNALLLAMLAGIALVTGLFFSAFLPAQLPRLQPFFGVVAAGAALLALDEAFELMETVAHNVGFLESTLGLAPQDAEGLLWVLPMAGFLWYFRDVLRSSRLVAGLWTLGAVLFFGGIAIDLGFSARFEDALEIAATCAFLAGFTALAFDRLVGEMAQELLGSRGNGRAMDERLDRPLRRPERAGTVEGHGRER